MCEPFFAVLRLVATWLGFALAFCGLGFHLRRLFGLGRPAPGDLFAAFWSGWVIVLALLQLWHLALPIDGRAVVAVALLGLTGAWRERRVLPELAGRPAAGAGAALLALGVAVLALGPLKYFDTGFYHLSVVEWIQSYPIVPGLGNLHGRLAFNSSFFLYVTLLETVWSDGARYAANSLLMLALLLQVLGGSVRYLHARRGTGRVPRLPDLLALLMLGPIAAQVLGPAFSSTSSDLPVFAIGVVVTLAVVRLATEPPASAREGLYRLLVVFLTLAGGLAVKLSFLVYGGLMGVLALGAWWRGRRPSSRECRTAASVLAAVALAVLVPWVARSIVLSGYAVFPGGYLPVDVDWRVPRPLALDDARFIYGMARSRSDHWIETSESWAWVDRWWRELPGNTARHLAAAVLAGVALLARLPGLRRRPPPGAATVGLAVAASLLALTWWFTTAPDPRFAGALFAILVAGLAALALSPPGERPLDLVVAALLLAFLAVPSEDSLHGRQYCRPPDWDYETRTTDSGLEVQVPAEGIQTWKLPLPSTPYFRPTLRLRRPGDLGGGFYLDPAVTLADLEEGSIPRGFRLSPELGVQLVSGWRRLEHAEDPRVLVGTGRMLVYSERARQVRLRLAVRSIVLARKPLGSCRLRILAGGRVVGHEEIRPGATFEVEVPLGRDFNDIVLEPSAEARALGEPLRRIEITLDELAITSSALGGERDGRTSTQSH